MKETASWPLALESGSRGRVAPDRDTSRFSRFSLFFSLFFERSLSSYFSLDASASLTAAKLILLDNERSRSKSIVTDLFRVVTIEISTVTARYRAISSVPLDSEQSAYQSADDLVRTARYERYHSKFRTLVHICFFCYVSNKKLRSNKHHIYMFMV